MAGMLGLVLCDNVLALFVFWEITSISSFFLIGFNNENIDSRKSALISLAVTGGGGFLLLVGFILMGSIGGSYSIKELVNQSSQLQNSPFFILLLILVFGGAFTKSAQFPFHFWLPGAMKAPTPVSAYLHSATMVKAGIYLLARLTPVLGNNTSWSYTLMIVGGFTMLYAVVHSIMRTDLKGILAYSTITALGMLVFLLGIGTTEAFIAAAVFILVHALYKAGLFLITGVIDHEAGTRNITELRGLRKVMLPVAVAGLLAALSSAGLPLTFGFIGKELIYEATMHSGNLFMLLTGAAIFTNVLLLYTGFLAGIKPFTGALPKKFEKLHSPPLLMWLPPLILGVTGVVLGVFPSLIDSALVQPVVYGLQSSAQLKHLAVWHGFNLILLLSAITLAVGTVLYFLLKPSESRLAFLDQFKSFSPQHITTVAANKMHDLADRFTAIFQSGYLRAYVLFTMIFIILLLSYKLFFGVNIYVNVSALQSITVYEAVIVGTMFVAIFYTLSTKSRLIAVASMGVVGYCMCLIFVFYSAPDLAMTQFTIDTLTVVLFVLVLFRLPHFLKLSNPRLKIRDVIISLSFGTLISIIALEVLNEKVYKATTHYYADKAYVLAHGKNVVNVILVDFRGMDTLVEITVLTIAAIGVFSMLKLKISLSEKE